MKPYTFKGGVHPSCNKDRSKTEAIQTIEAPAELVIPLSQHIGAPAVAVVEKGDTVKAGQLIGEPGGFISAAVHSPVSGKVLAVEPRPGMGGIPVTSVVIENDGEYSAVEYQTANWEDLEGEQIVERVKQAGIVGLGGATFPANVKLSPPPDKKIDAIILNGAECEPYLTADHRLMLEAPQKIVDGLRIMQKVLGAKSCYIGIENNKLDAVETMKKAAQGTSIEIAVLKVKYPQGGEKQLIDAVLGRKVPSASLPMDVGVVVQNVGTSAAIYDAVAEGRPLTQRVVTLTGAGVKKPANFMVPIGTPIGLLLEKCETELKDGQKLVLGGPMMGFAQNDANMSVVKGTSGVLVLDAKKGVPETMACIQCGRCVSACPMHLVPCDLSAYTDHSMWDEAADINALDCMECGSCAFACPSGIPLVQKIRLSKAEIMAKKRKSSK